MKIELLYKKEKITLSANSILFRSHTSANEITPLFPDSYVIFTSPIEISSIPLDESNFKVGYLWEWFEISQSERGIVKITPEVGIELKNVCHLCCATAALSKALDYLYSANPSGANDRRRRGRECCSI